MLEQVAHIDVLYNMPYLEIDYLLFKHSLAGRSVVAQIGNHTTTIRDCNLSEHERC